MYPQKENKHTVPIVISSILILTFLFIFVFKPSYIGYAIYQDVQKANTSIDMYTTNLNSLNQELESTRTNLSYNLNIQQELNQKLDTTTNALKECEIETKSCQKEITLLEKSNTLDITGLQKQLNQTISLYEQKLDLKDSQLQQQKQTITKTTQEQTDKCSTQIESLTNNTQEIQSQLSDLQDKYNLLIINTAKNICCKQKVDNPKINFYNILEHRIVCLEEGETKLIC